MQEPQGVCGYVSRFNPCVYSIPASSEIIICSQGRLIRQRQQFPGYICILETERIGVFSAKSRDMDIHIVVNADLALALAAAVEPSSVLRQCAASGDGHSQQQSVQPGRVKSFADVLSRGDYDYLFIGGQCLECSQLR